jgi:hypothetical protein
MWTKRLLFLAVVSAVMAGCGVLPKDKKDDDKDDNGAEARPVGGALRGFIAPGGIKVPANLKAVTAEDITRKLSPKAKGSGSSSTPDECSQYFDQAKGASRGSRIEFVNDVDTTTCLNNQAKNKQENTTFSLAKNRVYFGIECDGGDFAKANGKTYADFNKAPLTDSCTAATSRSFGYLMNLESTVRGTTTSGATVITIDIHMLMGNVAPDGGPCMTTPSGKGDCTSFSVIDETATVKGEEIKPSSDYFIATGHGLIVDNAKDTIVGGTKTFNYNGWEGTVQFTKDALPTWTARKGAESLQGTLTSAKDD